MSNRLKYDTFYGIVPQFVTWWNEQNELLYGSKARIVYLKEIEIIDHDNGGKIIGCRVEYVLQDIKE